MKTLRLIFLVIVAITLMTSAASATDRIDLYGGGKGNPACWLDTENGDLLLFEGDVIGEEVPPALGPIESISQTLIESDGFLLTGEDAEGSFLLYMGTDLYIELRNVRNVYEYLPGKFCAECGYSGDSNVYFWYMRPDVESASASINFGKNISSISFFDNGFGNRFFYGVNSQYGLMTGQLEGKEPIKAKKLATLADGTVAVNGKSYLGYFTKMGYGYSLDGKKHNALKFRTDDFTFFEGFILITIEGQNLKFFPENPVPITQEEAFDMFDNYELLSPFPD